MKLLSLSLFIIIISCTASCDSEHIQDYNIHNELDTSIFVHFNLNRVKWDSVVAIPPRTNLKIHTSISIAGTYPVDDPRYDDEMENIKISTIDTTISLDETYWVWEKESKYHGVSTIKIDSTLFK